MTQLFVNVFSDANGAGDFFAQELAVSRTQPGKVTAKRINRDTEAPGNLIVARQAYATGKKWFQRVEQTCLGGPLEFVLGPTQRPRSEGGRPDLFVLLLVIQFHSERYAPIQSLCCFDFVVQKHEFMFSTPFYRSRLVPGVGHVVLERRKQE
jgi:hypothetical protein